MGIPSYYKRLCQSVKGLVVPHRLQDINSFPVSTLVFDFNCMIYQVVRNPEFPPFPGYQDEFACAQWEKNLCEKVVDYTLSVWKLCGKPKQVFLGLDGVVPMAKIKQQRLRRFKSIWTASQESQTGPRWDTNALTPGTAFMNLLGERLKELCKTRKWTLSDTNEPGEGEHKCMHYLKELHQQKKESTGATVIYGLDADLILLSLLHAPKNSWLLREVTEWEGGKDGSKAVSDFMRLSIDKLFETYIKNTVNINEEDWKIEYVAAMSLLGNDFVPHSLTFKIRDGGHDVLLSYLKQIHSQNLRLVTNEQGRYVYNLQALNYIIEELSKIEEQKLVDFIKKKSQFVNHENSNLAPCEWAVEKQILCESKGVLKPNWNQYMLHSWFDADIQSSKPVYEYLRGLQWVLDYYTYQPNINTFWMYSWFLTPSWADVASVLQSLESWHSISFVEPSMKQKIQPHEQLALVLPLESWHFIQNSQLKTLPEKLPQFWPSSFGFFSAGRIFLWECEPLIPILSIDRIRQMR